MPFNGSGLFSRLYNWVNDRNLGVKITASRMDAEMDGFAAALSQAILKDGTQTVTANIPMNGKKITGLGDPTASGDAVHYGFTATDARPGVVQMATATEMKAGTANNRAATPLVMPVVITSEGTLAADVAHNIPLATGYRYHDVYIDGLVVSTAGANVNIRILSASVEQTSSSYWYVFGGRSTSGADAPASSSATSTSVPWMQDVSASYPAAGVLTVPQPDVAVGHMIQTHHSWVKNADGNSIGQYGSFRFNTGATISHLRLFPSAGTLSLIYRVYSWR